MQQDSPHKIDSRSLYTEFKQHIDIKNNDRVFFSGKFGTGKTTFLDDFFTEHTNQYDCYHLYPVNYQINKNEDVVELLKYDILVEILKRSKENGTPVFDDESVKGIKENFLLFYSFVKQNYSVNSTLDKIVSYGTDGIEVFDSVLKTKFHKLGRPLQDLLAVDKEWQKFKKAYVSGASVEVEKFLESTVIREDDLMTHLIQKEIVKSDKETVLVIDDLDRIDPEHIFRILNIFSAFQEREKGTNKFGFDKVIIVGDLENIKHIFHHFYGPHTDFTGYIDKFFSRDVYRFSNNEIIGAELIKLLKLFGQKNGRALEDFRSSHFVYDILHNLLLESLSLKKESFTLRQIVRILKFNESILRDADYPTNDPRANRHQQVWSATKFAINVCKIVFEDEDNFKSVCEKILQSDGENNNSDSFYKSYSAALLYQVQKVDFHSVMFRDEKSSIRWRGVQIGPAGEDAIQVLTKTEGIKDIRQLYYTMLIESI